MNKVNYMSCLYRWQHILYMALFLLTQSTGCTSSAYKTKEELDIQYQSRKYVYKKVNIHYIDQGAGSTIVLIHGFGASSYSWRYVIDSFSKNHRIIAIDMKGFGLSDKPLDDKYKIEDQSDLVISLCDELGLRDFTLAGHSFGGAVALVTYLKFLDSGRNPVSKMILIGSASYKQDFPYFINILRLPVVNYMSLLLMPDKFNTRTLLSKAFFDDTKITESMTNTYAYYLSLPGAYHSLISTADQIIPSNIDSIVDRYKEIKVPVLVIWGGEDKIVPLENGQRLIKDIPNARLHVVRSCGHLPQEECPVETIRAIKAFLE